MHPRIALLVITDGRHECLDRTIASFAARWGPLPLPSLTVVDDSADPAYGRWLEVGYAGPNVDFVHNPTRLGFGGAIAAGWDALGARDPAPEWVFHLEDDFEFTRAIPAEAMVAVLHAHPYLAQMALRRQPWGSDAHLPRGYIDRFGEDAFTPRSAEAGSWLEHRRFFTTNPCLYSAALMSVGWPQRDHSEGHFTNQLLDQGFAGVEGYGVRFGIWGGLEDEPWVHHIGAERVGTGY